MGESAILEFTTQALVLVLVLSLPPIIAAASVGLLVSLLQALTQVQEQTVSFAIKLITVIITILLTARWVGGEVMTYSLRLFDTFPLITK